MYGRGEGEGEGEGGGGKKAKAESAYIPPDLCGEILYRLPSNDLLNYKLVSKEWLQLISSTGFIQKHLERSKAECNDLRIVLPFRSDTDVINCANDTTKKIKFAFRGVLGLCDGLILYYDHRKIAALNPCTGEIDKRVPNPCIKDNMEALSIYGLVFSWFGHHPSTSTSAGEYQYALVLANKSKGETKDRIRIVFNVYTLSRNNINNITAFTSSTLEVDKYYFEPSSKKIGTLLHGRLHWSANLSNKSDYSYKQVIVVYDFETNQVLTMSPPKWTKILGVVNGCLCAATRAKAVWMMKVYGVEKSWTKYADVEGYYSDILTPLAFSPNGDHLIIIHDNVCKTLTKHSLKERKRHRERDQNQIKIVDDYYTTTAHRGNACIAFACIDSLVSPTLLWKDYLEE